MKKISLLIYKVAGIDTESIEIAPKVDKIYGHHLGVALSFTFIIVFMIGFYSFSYIGGRSIEYDIATSSFINVKSNESLIFFLSVLIAFTIAMIITLFDRMLFMSDWFHVRPFGVDKHYSVPESATYGLKKLFRIIIRIAMSLAVAYSLSIFLELKVFESEVLRNMQIRHLEDNKPIYNDLRDYKKELEESKENLNNELNNELNILQGDYNIILKNDPSDLVSNPDIAKLDTKIINNTSKQNAAIQKIRSEYKDELYSLDQKCEKHDQSILTISKEIEIYKKNRDAEIAGYNPENLANISGKPTCGPRCTYWKKQIRNASEKRDDYIALKNTITSQIRHINSEINARIQTIDGNFNKINQELLKNKNKITDAIRKKFVGDDEHRDKVLKRYDAKITALKKKIIKEEEEITLRYNSKKEALFSGTEFKPLTDGPLSRLTALNLLKHPKIETLESKTIIKFSFWVKAFVIFLEIVPVLSKMFFSPPTSYAFIVQGKVGRANIEELKRNEKEISEHEKEFFASKEDRMRQNHFDKEKNIFYKTLPINKKSDTTN